MRRLSALDGSFLRIETPNAHMHVGWLATLKLRDGSEELACGQLAARIAGRLQLAPRFRQRVVAAPLGDPGWVDDPAFRLDRHLVVGSRAPRGRQGRGDPSEGGPRRGGA